MVSGYFDPAINYADQCASFEWKIPAHFNIGVDVCDKWAEFAPDNPAILFSRDGRVNSLTFDQLKCQSNQMANLFTAVGVEQGDRVAVFLEQSVEVAVSHVAIYKCAAIAVPLFYLFGSEAIEYRLKDSGAKVIITDCIGAAKVIRVRHQLPELRSIIVVDGHINGCLCWQQLCLQHSSEFTSVNTLADDPALIIYTSGTTGQPKGALHAHRVLLGHLPGVEMSHNGFPGEDEVIWTPADWAWIGGLLDVLMPALHHGVPVVAHRFTKFNPEEAYALLELFAVRSVFLPPTALRAMATVSNPRDRWDLKLRSIASGGEPLGSELQAWCRDSLSLDVNEFYGQTECNMIVSSCHTLFDVQPGTIGKAVPGHRVAVVDANGSEVPVETPGVIAVRKPDPVMLLEYWNNPHATSGKFIGDWLLTGDMAQQDSQGNIRFIGRDDDIINSSGYRIGPAEIEDCLNAHDSVYRSAVIGKPDKKRTEIVKAFIVLNSGFEASDVLIATLQQHVKGQLAAHEFPREIAFVDQLPTTTTGKIIRKALREKERDRLNC